MTRGSDGGAQHHDLASARAFLTSQRAYIILMPALIADLFNTPLLPGLTARTAFLSPAEEAELIGLIDAQRLSPFKFQGWLGKRLTTSFGFHYDFERGQFGATEPIPDWLTPVKTRAAAFAGIMDADLVQALLIRYDPGAGIGWHRDRPVFEHVVGISLGAPAVMRFRKRTQTGFRRVSAPLEPRSIYHLSGEARHGWEHGIAEMDETRWSITFRSFSDKGLREQKAIG
jgi:alkylated DNA repair dioxygenase AlkB